MSSRPQSSAPASRHSRTTRLFHTGLALAVLAQLGTSLLMAGPDETDPGDLLFQIHRYAGLAAFGFAFALWATILMRSRGTELGALIPWFSLKRLAALSQDIRSHAAAMLRLRLPEPAQDSALPSAVHGLGLLLITAMATSGTVYFLQVALGLHSPEPDGMLAMTVHLTLANLVWVYLIAHAGLALLHHLLRSMSLSEMWSLRR